MCQPAMSNHVDYKYVLTARNWNLKELWLPQKVLSDMDLLYQSRTLDISRNPKMYECTTCYLQNPLVSQEILLQKTCFPKEG